jgi:hypothetical protein
MRNTQPYIVEVLFVPLPAHEIEERRRRLRALLLTGAARVAQQRRDSDQMSSESEIPERLSAQVAPK